MAVARRAAWSTSTLRRICSLIATAVVLCLGTSTLLETSSGGRMNKTFSTPTAATTPWWRVRPASIFIHVQRQPRPDPLTLCPDSGSAPLALFVLSGQQPLLTQTRAEVAQIGCYASFHSAPSWVLVTRSENGTLDARLLFGRSLPRALEKVLSTASAPPRTPTDTVEASIESSLSTYDAVTPGVSSERRLRMALTSLYRPVAVVTLPQALPSTSAAPSTASPFALNRPFHGRVKELHQAHLEHASRAANPAALTVPTAAPPLDDYSSPSRSQLDVVQIAASSAAMPQLLSGERLALLTTAEPDAHARDLLQPGHQRLARLHGWLSRLVTSGFLDPTSTVPARLVVPTADDVAPFRWLLETVLEDGHRGSVLVLPAPPGQPVVVEAPTLTPTLNPYLLEPCAVLFNTHYLVPQLVTRLRRQPRDVIRVGNATAPKDEWASTWPTKVVVTALPGDAEVATAGGGDLANEAVLAAFVGLGYTRVPVTTPWDQLALLLHQASVVVVPFRIATIVARFAVRDDVGTGRPLALVVVTTSGVDIVNRDRFVTPPVHSTHGGITVDISSSSAIAPDVCVRLLQRSQPQQDDAPTELAAAAEASLSLKCPVRRSSTCKK